MVRRSEPSMRTSSGLSLARSMPAMDWPWTTRRMRSAVRMSGEDGAGFAAFDDGIKGVDDGFEAGEVLDFVDDYRDGGIEGSGAAGDEGGEAGGEAGGGVVEEEGEGGGAEDEGEEEGEERGGGASAGVVLGGHGVIVCGGAGWEQAWR